LSLAGNASSMKSKRFIVLGGVALLVIAYIIFLAPNVRHRSERLRIVGAFETLPRERAASAVASFARDRRAKNTMVPKTASLGELVSGGYLKPQDAKAFEGAQVAFHTDAGASYAQDILAEARLSDGAIIILLSDGSVQQISQSRYRDQIRQQIKPISQQKD
jgi:hypothetical protein